MENFITFEDLGLSNDSINAIKKKGFEKPSPIQEKIIPLLLKEDIDIIGQAQTGTGKTAAFGLPLLEKIDEKQKNVQAIILAPTRELAVQVASELNSLKGKKKIAIFPIYGGQSIENQISNLRKGIQIVVGTPGRVIDHIKRKTMNIYNVRYFVLDEADEMLNMGFIDDVKYILSKTGEDKRIMLFSATIPNEILDISKRYMEEPKIVRTIGKEPTPSQTEQIYFEVNPYDKLEALSRIIDIETNFYGLIFCRTKVSTEEVANKLAERGYEAEALHGDFSQNQRERVLASFKRKKVKILVCTDVAARGLDIDSLTHVINYSLPQDPESYIHRIGRTGRAGKDGTAITFVTPEEYRKLFYIKKITKTEIKKKKIPGVEEIVQMKRDKILSGLSDIIEEGKIEKYKKIAEEILENYPPEQAVAALIKMSFGEELDEKNYNQIKKLEINRKGKTRLFVSLGKEGGYNRDKLIKYITEKTKVPANRIRDIDIFDNFSFITAPFEDAEIILEVFKRRKKGKRPLITKAKERKRK